MTSDDFVSAIDGLTFDESGRTWTLEVDDIDDSEPDAFAITVRVPEADSEIHFQTSRDRELDLPALPDHIVDIAHDMVTGRVQSGLRTAL
jgi:hypothetical protein